MFNRFSFFLDGESCRSHGMVCSGSGVWDAPERDVDIIEIPGRSGTLTVDNGRWKNVTVTYPILITPPFAENSAAARAWLCLPGSRRLEDERYPGVYRMARLRGGITFKPTAKLDAATANVVFDCAPQRWLKSGEDPVVLTAAGTLVNPTQYDALPTITVEGTGAATLTVGEYQLTIDNIDGSITLNSSIQRAYNGTMARDGAVSGVYPVLPAGSTAISWEGSGVTSVTVIPRWWTI